MSAANKTENTKKTGGGKQAPEILGAATLPRWEPEDGKAFIAEVVGVDKSEVGRTLYVLTAAHGIVCRRGIEEITVPAGSRFSMAPDPMLDPLEYVGLGNVGIASVKKIELGDGARAWKWSVRLSTAQKKKVDQAREDAAIPF